MDVFNVQGTISETEWAIARLYTVLIFRKTTSTETALPNQLTKENLLLKEEWEEEAVQPTIVDSSPHYPIPLSPQYPPRTIGSLIDPKDPVVKLHQTKYCQLLTTRNIAKRPSTEVLSIDYENADEEMEISNEEEMEEEIDLMELRQKAMELAGVGEELWDNLNEEDIEKFIEQAKQILRSASQVSKGIPAEVNGHDHFSTWTVYEPHSPDHPPPNYYPQTKRLKVDTH